ncbi:MULTISPECIES: cation:proton antiporter [Salegentibacter]|uniref:Sodium/proton antiporter, CPA1 family n=1 Tax=Salegentibacter agarivorans TaxID=345907 RepID=A0A1I2MEV3_9FLAO|nr:MULTISPECIES: sodium:proton antiporter [Salegentibacter]APS38134.1 cell shape-determining protein [Salegentibacter sp. T436]MBO2543558.1 sodium:proton antiporter [Salegentibacter sp. BDJ18]SFF90025.1 sodium/proton antiporter, CPA1 family [Salegentibacter agarivorans]
MLELASLVILGILAQWLAWKIKTPAILPLILIGLLVGPISTLISEDGTKWVEPIWNGSEGLFPGESLFYFVSLAISVILFEGGLTLKRSEVGNIGPVILKLISVGSVVTFLGAGLAAHFIFDLSWQISFLFSALIIVTGPTVISPILRNIPLKSHVSSILKWEGILIDPIGALISVLMFEFIRVEGGQDFTQTALIEFGKILLFGFTFGFTFAHLLAFLIKRQIIPHYLLNVFILATVLGVFVLADTFAHESGLLAVVIMGMVMGNQKLPNIKELLYFKESLSVLLISILFILLAANIEIEELLLVFNWNSLILFGVVVLLIRPLGVILSSLGSGLKVNEIAFVSWVGPRGIVAAGIASLFGLRLAREGIAGAEYITPLVFMIVLCSVLLNAATARLFARLVGVFIKDSQGILIIGASSIARLIGKYLHDNERHVVLLDNNSDNVKKARDLGIDAIEGSVYSDDLMNNVELNDIGYLMAMTGNSDINKTAITKFKKQFGENGSFRVITADEMNNPEKNPAEGLFSHTDDYIKLTEVSRSYPKIHELVLNSKEHYEGLIEISKTDPDIIPLFVKNNKGGLTIIPSHSSDVEIEEGFQLVYLGKKIQREEKGEEDYNETIDEEETVDALEGDREEQEQEK